MTLIEQPETVEHPSREIPGIGTLPGWIAVRPSRRLVEDGGDWRAAIDLDAFLRAVEAAVRDALEALNVELAKHPARVGALWWKQRGVVEFPASDTNVGAVVQLLTLAVKEAKRKRETSVGTLEQLHRWGAALESQARLRSTIMGSLRTLGVRFKPTTGEPYSVHYQKHESTIEDALCRWNIARHPLS